MCLPLVPVLMVLLSALAAEQSRSAQTAALPSDVELASAYCIGVLQRQLAISDETVAKTQGMESYFAQRIREHKQELSESLQRLQSYLVPRIPYLDVMALAGASARADADVDLVLGQGRRASDECQRAGADGEMQCTLSKAQASRSWQRIDRCGRIDFLPF